ncbi:response regulator [Variovorax sp. 38R]|uniref:response regulator n=1 Tax=Variovorax sp. 38R TaxID=2774875 RepID=UPI001785A14D|nr:response regulator [Variovorax sp. 38R]QOF76111.1 response regulator [Variovorax sp. 38R]
MPLVTILIEDSKTIRDHLIPALRELADIDVVAFAETASQAVETLQQNDAWELAIVDLFLKEGSGLAVLRACQSRAAHKHVVVLTNYLNTRIREECLMLGADAVFDKSNEIEAFFDHCHGIRRQGQ